MPRYKVSDMTCGHCASVVEKAVKLIDPKAGVSVDLATGHVDVRSNVDADRIAEAIRSAGYENRSIAA